MKNIYEINAFWDEAGDIRPFHLTISEPTLDSQCNDFYCRIHAPALFEKDKDIYGVDEAQAVKLAAEFVTRMLSSRRLTDIHGAPVDFADSMRNMLNSSV